MMVIEMIKHTPGPWAWHWNKLSNGDADGRVHTAYGNVLSLGMASCIAVSPRYQTKEQWEADAALIAEAPALLEVLIKLSNEAAGWRGYEAELRQIAGNTNFACLMQRVDEARAAIAKATSQTLTAP